jgi:hypothetical protein
MRQLIWAVLLASIACSTVLGQDEVARADLSAPTTPEIIALTVPTGTPLPVVLDKELRIRKVGQPVQGKVAEPVYAFDKLVVPAGSELIGRVSRIGSISKQSRTVAALNANLSPSREIQLDFDELVLPEGRHLAIHTLVLPASQGVLQFAASDAKEKDAKGKGSDAKTLAAKKASETRQEINREWETAKKQFTEPGKIHRLERFAVAQLPYHPQYLDAGTRFNAELQQPLDFGEEALTPEKMRAIGTAPPDGSIIHALLTTPLSSADSKKGQDVEAVMTEPLFAANQLILPEGTHLKGAVLNAQPARRMHRNGQLRIVFHEVVPPNAAQQHVEASLEGVEVKSDQHLSLDAEGGAQATTPKTRYLTTGISIALAASSFSSESDPGRTVERAGGDTGPRALNGASGFRVIGTLVGVFVHSRALASGFGVYGAGMSVYSHFLARGRDVVYPEDTAMAIGFGSRVTGAAKPANRQPL